MPYPDNMPPSRRAVEEFRCTNPECEMKSWEVSGVHDLGTFRADNDDDVFCPDCGKEGN